MGCNSCAYLKSSNKKHGKVDGCLYYCACKKTYVNATSKSCDNYKSAYRDSYTLNEIYRNSDDFYDDDTPVSTYLVILIIMIITGLILGVFK